jgi:hypothetical protein
MKALVCALLVAMVFNDVRPQALVLMINDMINSRGEIVDRLYLARQNANIVDNFGSSLPRAEAAIDANEREYHVTVGPITGVASANYVYASLFNPSGSGRTVLVKRLMVRANAVAAANYVNVSVRRITTATIGSQITAADIPKKNASSSNPVAEVRSTNPTVTFVGTADSRLLGQPMPGAIGHEYSYREIVFDETDEPIVLQPGEGIAVYQEAAGDTDQRVRATFEWEEVTAAPAAADEYMLALPRVENAAATNYVYNTFFNPGTSTRAAVIKRIWFGSETCDNAAVYRNNIIVKRVSAASGGTYVAPVNIPKKHTGSPSSIIDVRHTGATVTQVGGADARLLHVTPCGAAGEQSGWYEFDTRPEDEQIVVKPGEGIALVSEYVGDIDQINRMFIEWKEVSMASVPAEEGEYLWSSGKVGTAAALGTTFFTAYNPNTSGRTALVKRIVIRATASTTATYNTLNFQRISTSTTGTLIAAADIPKKNSSTTNSVMQIRWCGATCATTITTSYVGNRSILANGLSDSGILKAVGPAAVGQLHGHVEMVFMPNEPLVLRPGEGIGVYNNFRAGDVDQGVKISIEWDEETTVATDANRYVIDIGAMQGDIGASYNYATFFNPAASTKTVLIKKTALRVNATNTATHSPIQVKRISAASGGNLIVATDIPKKDTNASTSAVEIRRGGVTATYAQSVDAQFLAVQTPAAVASAAALAQMGWKELSFIDDEPIVLQPGEGIVLNNNAAASPNHILYWYLEWEEVLNANMPAPEGDYLMSIGPVTGATANSYVYATLFNPATSSRLLVLTRAGIRANRTGAPTAPSYIPITLRKIATSTGGTQILPANVPEKNASTSPTIAEIRRGGPSVLFTGATTSRLFGVTAPGVVQQSIAITENEFVFGDEFILRPGEGMALYQESNSGDANLQYYMTMQWREASIPAPPQSLTFSISDNAIGFGTLLPGAARYATGNGAGSSTDSAAAHSITVSTNASDGYTVFLDGSTLTCSECAGATITAIGATATSSGVGTEQFGIRATVGTGTGVVAAPYNTVDWALDTAAFPDTFATGTGDGVTTQYDIRYIGNIAAQSEAGTYTANLTYIVTGTF